MSTPPPPTTTKKRSIGIRTPPPLRPRIVLYGVEKFGKTTFGVHAPDPVIVMAPNERGYDTLAAVGSVPQIPSIVASNWKDVLDAVAKVKADGFKTLVLDALGGLSSLCANHVCETQFKGDWSERGFNSYGKGNARTADEWDKFIGRLDVDNFPATVVMLGHAKTKTVKNPMGDDYDAYMCDCHEKIWDATARWADAILFGKFETIVDKETGASKGKGIGGAKRVIYTDKRDAFQAGNRYHMPFSFYLSGDPKQSWNEIWTHIQGAKA